MPRTARHGACAIVLYLYLYCSAGATEAAACKLLAKAAKESQTHVDGCFYLCHHCCWCAQGFWEERALRKQQGQQLGPAVLLFGCRNPSSGFLFQDTLSDIVQQGVLSKALPAFSRAPGLPKTYVQVGIETALLCHSVLCCAGGEPYLPVYACWFITKAQHICPAACSALERQAVGPLEHLDAAVLAGLSAPACGRA